MKTNTDPEIADPETAETKTASIPRSKTGKPGSEPDPPIWPWVLPFFAYMILLMFDPSLDPNPYANLERESVPIRRVSDVETKLSQESDLPTRAQNAAVFQYIGITALRFLIVGGLLVYGFRHYRKQFPLRVGLWWLPVGIVGVVIWVGLCHLEIESTILVACGFEENALGERASFNPFQAIDPTGLLVSFLLIRFAILAVVVPLAEEIFLRGFLMRFVQQNDWWNANLGKLKWTAMAVAPLYGVLTHPSEFLAALAWFSLVTLLMVHTRNLWECVLAHATTNLLLGVYVVLFNQWQLW